jgi:hypothetical protein
VSTRRSEYLFHLRFYGLENLQRRGQIYDTMREGCIFYNREGKGCCIEEDNGLSSHVVRKEKSTW